MKIASRSTSGPGNEGGGRKGKKGKEKERQTPFAPRPDTTQKPRSETSVEVIHMELYSNYTEEVRMKSTESSRPPIIGDAAVSSPGFKLLRCKHVQLQLGTIGCAVHPFEFHRLRAIEAPPLMNA